MRLYFVVWSLDGLEGDCWELFGQEALEDVVLVLYLLLAGIELVKDTSLGQFEEAEGYLARDLCLGVEPLLFSYFSFLVGGQVHEVAVRTVDLDALVVNFQLELHIGVLVHIIERDRHCLEYLIETAELFLGLNQLLVELYFFLANELVLLARKALVEQVVAAQ